MTLNQELIRTRCLDISESVERLDKIRHDPRDTFLKDLDTQDIACYRLLVAIEAALGICYHIAAKQLKKVPEQYAECFALVGDAGIISSELSENLQKMAPFRNLLVHMYWKVDYEAVYQIIQNGLNDLRRFSEVAIALV
jgi:uncharacterized protein YutE (UPF0331/DUF86 family)